jgi:hypothetical protein
MEISKTQSKTTLTIKTTVKELQANLTAYQTDMMQEMVAELYRSREDGESVDWRDAAKFALICMQKGDEFDALVEKTGTPWIPSPLNGAVSSWVDTVINHPYIFGLTDEVVTEDVQEVVLILNGGRFVAVGLKDNI